MMKHKASKKGFTLVELMIVIAIVAILVGLALPSYTQFIRKANRGEAQQLLMNWANNQEIWRANHTDYAQDIDAELKAPTHDKYDFALPVRGPTTYTLTATPSTPDQLKDKEHGTPCTALNLDQSNAKTPPQCW
jgi:type IV pilus assembly protein PilE